MEDDTNTDSSVGEKALTRKAATTKGATKASAGVKRKAATTWYEERGLSWDEALKAMDLRSRITIVHCREMECLQYEFDSRLQSLKSDVDDARSEVEGLCKYVFGNPALLEDHEASYANNTLYRMWYDAKMKKDAIAKGFKELLQEHEKATAALRSRQEKEKARQMEIFYSTLASNAASSSKKTPVKEITITDQTDPAYSNRLLSPLSSNSTSTASSSSKKAPAKKELTTTKTTDQTDPSHRLLVSSTPSFSPQRERKR
jgi:hypothetical protein